jgi:hypothetical protein
MGRDDGRASNDSWPVGSDYYIPRQYQEMDWSFCAATRADYDADSTALGHARPRASYGPVAPILASAGEPQ